MINRPPKALSPAIDRVGRWRVDSVVNLAKIPIYTWHNLHGRASLAFALMMVPVVVVGNVKGIWLVRRIPQRVFETLIIILTTVSSIALFVWWRSQNMNSENGSLDGKVIVITGATSGIGQAAAEKLASMGARLILVARSRERAAATLRRLAEISPVTTHTVYYGDLSLIAETQRVGNEIAVTEPQIDVLINNAGGLFTRHQVTADGLEMTFALNHMSYFILTACLRDKLSPTARVVNTSSTAHRGAKFNLEGLKSPNPYRAFRAYSLSKLCNILFTRELARQFGETDITVNCLHPGFVASRFFENQTGPMSVLFKPMMLVAITPEKGAETVVYLASSNEVAGVSGKYFSKCRERTPTREARNDQAAAVLWEESARLWASG